MLREKVVSILTENNCIYDEKENKVTIVADSSAGYNLSLEFEHIKNDYVLLAVLSYEIASFSFDKLEHVYKTSVKVDLADVELQKAAMDIYKTMCHVSNKINDFLLGGA